MSPPAPAGPVTLPVANALLMLPALSATSPPAVPFVPTLTAPLAQVWPAAQSRFAGTVVPDRARILSDQPTGKGGVAAGHGDVNISVRVADRRAAEVRANEASDRTERAADDTYCGVGRR